MVFDPACAAPLKTITHPHLCYGLAYVASLHATEYDLLYLDKQFDLIKCTTTTKISKESDGPSLVDSTTPSAKTVFAAIYGAHKDGPRESTTKPTASTVVGIPNHVLSFLEIPSHVIAPPSKLSLSLLESLSKRRVDVEMDIDLNIDKQQVDDESGTIEIIRDGAKDLGGEKLIIPKSFDFLEDLFSSMMVQSTKTKQSKKAAPLVDR